MPNQEEHRARYYGTDKGTAVAVIVERVAVLPHTDHYMRGIRYVRVTAIDQGILVGRCESSGTTVALVSSDYRVITNHG